MNIRYIRETIVAICFLVLLVLIAVKVNEGDRSEFRGAVRVVDGDTIVMDGERLRLAGLDAPEIYQACYFDKVEWMCGLAARDQLERLVRGADLVCKAGRRDKYRRPLVICKAGGIEINREMVRTGLAVDYGSYVEEAEMARAESLGLWASRFERPEIWRRHNGAMDGVMDSRVERFFSGIWASIAAFFNVR